MTFAYLFTTILLATTALAVPRPISSRPRADNRRSGPVHRIENVGLSEVASNISHVQYSTNWAGAVWNSPANTYTKVVGTFTVPTPSAPDGSASAWVGIDGDTCNSAILQTGVDFYYQGGAISYDSWYEWFPDYAHNFDGISFNAGDVVRLTVAAISTTSGTAIIENLTNGQTVSKDLSYPQYPLCEQDAEWIVEDFESNGSQVPFTNFGTVTFTDAAATKSDGSSVTPNGANVLDIAQNGTVFTTVTETADGVTIQYI